MKSYLLSVVVAAVLCGVVRRMVGEKGALGSMIRLLTGIVLALTVMTPLTKVELTRLSDITGTLSADGREAASVGVELSRNMLAESITARTEAYILDKAAALGVTLTAEIRLTDEEIPRPREVVLTGQVSPNAKAALSSILTEELGIERENQLWN